MKTKYRNLCAKETSIPIFSRDWWLDATAGEDNWDVVLVEKGDKIIASLPYTFRKKYSLTILGQPQLTQTLGPWLRASNAKYAKRLGQEKELLQALIEQLPDFAQYKQNWHYNITNWLPFYWQGFEQTTNYTYVLNEINDKEKLWNNLQVNIRTDIRKAKERYKLIVCTDVSIDDFLQLNKMVFTRKNRNPPYSDSLVKRIDDACILHNCRKIFIAEDDQGRKHAAVYIIWDENSSYYLMGGSDPKLRNSGATSLCMWEAIKFASTVTKRFDFEGSMLESVERFFRAFGAVQTPYFSISKTPSWPLQFRKLLQNLKK